MSWIAVAAATTVKLHDTSAAIVSGGSSVSWSVTLAATITTVHDSPAEKSVSGFSVYEAADPVTAAVCVPLVPQEIVYQPSATSTGSLKVTPMFASGATPVSPVAGVWLLTPGAVSVTAGATFTA